MMAQLELRTSPAFYVIFGGIMGGALVLGIYVSIVKEPAFWSLTLVSAGLLLAVLSWLVTTKLTLANDGIHYRSLFVRRHIPLARVLKAEVAFGFSSFEPHQRLTIIVRGPPDGSVVVINIGLFDRRKIKYWMDALHARLNLSPS